MLAEGFLKLAIENVIFLGITSLTLNPSVIKILFSVEFTVHVKFLLSVP